VVVGPPGRAYGGPVTTRARWIAISTRLAVWGLVVGLIPTFAFYGGGPRWLWQAGWLTAVGLCLSGVGMMTAGALVVRSLPRGVSAVKVASLAAMPLGLGFVAVSLTALAPLSRFTDFVDATGPLAVLLGVIVVVALFAGFLGRRRP